MIYLKNIREIQTVYIPRTEINGKVVAVKSYDEGYADGKEEGKKLQKLKLTNLTVSENGVYKREDGWNEVEIDVPDIPSKTQKKTLYVTKNTDVVLPDEGYDGLSQVNINATQYGQDKRNEGYEDGYNAGNKKGYADGKTEGIAIQKNKLTNLSVTTNGTYERTDGWNKINVNVPSQTPKLQQKNITLTKDIETVTPSTGYDGLTKVGIDATSYVKTKRDEGYAEGHLQGKTEGYENGKADGIEEGYNQGYADGKAEGGEINLVELDETPKFGDGENNIVEYKPSNYNADGFSNVKINITSVYHSGYMEGNTEGYNQGYNAGYEEGKSDVKLIEISDAPKMAQVNSSNNLVYTPSEYSADGFSKVNINVTNIYDEGKTNGISEQKAKLTNLTVTENGTYSNTDGWNSVSVSVSQANFKTQTKTLVVTKDSEVVAPDSNYDGLSKVTVNASQYGQTKRNEGYEEGYDEGFERGVSVQKISMRYGTKFAYSTFKSVPSSSLDWYGVKDMSFMFYECQNLTTIPSIDTSSVTTMYNAFYGCNIETIPLLDTSKVTNMQGAFYSCTNLIDISEIDTSSVTDMDMMFYGCTGLNRLPALDCSKVTSIDQFFGNYTITNLLYFGGFINLKRSMTNYGLEKAPNLTETACINVLNGLYDFTGNNQTPTSSQGKLKVHQNFLDKVGSRISIATNKGWTITA